LVDKAGSGETLVLAGWLGGWVAGWLGGWVAGWLGGWVAGVGVGRARPG
jgi:hypothetical protein